MSIVLSHVTALIATLQAKANSKYKHESDSEYDSEDEYSDDEDMQHLNNIDLSHFRNRSAPRVSLILFLYVLSLI